MLCKNIQDKVDIYDNDMICMIMLKAAENNKGTQLYTLI